jgi:drug/metabolite transporter (DMT)-like permease
VTADARHRTERLGIGAVLTTASFFCVALVSALGKVAGETTSTGFVVLMQNLVPLVVIAPVVARGGRATLRTNRIGLHIVRAATGTACWYALFIAVRTIPLTTANLLTFSAPLWMPVLAWVGFRQRTSRNVWIGAGLGFAGIVLVLQPTNHQFDPGELLALGGALMLAIALIAVRALGATEPTIRVLFYYFALSSLLVLPLAMLDWRPPTSAETWLVLLAIGVAQFLSQIFIVFGYRFASAVRLSPIVYSVIVFSAVIDWVFWGHQPTLAVLGGMALVIGGGLVAILMRPRAAGAVVVAPPGEPATADADTHTDADAVPDTDSDAAGPAGVRRRRRA